MRKMKITALLLVAATLNIPLAVNAQEHPNLIMTKAGVQKVRSNLGSVPLFDASVQSVKKEVDAEIALGIDTPRIFQVVIPTKDTN